MKKIFLVIFVLLALNIIFRLFWIYFFSQKNFEICEKLFLISNFWFPSLDQAKCSFWKKDYQKTLDILNSYKLNNFEKYWLIADTQNILASSSWFDILLANQALENYQKSFWLKKDKIFENNYNFLLSKFEKNKDSNNSSWDQNQVQNSQKISEDIQKAQTRIENQNLENPYQDQEFIIDKDGYILLQDY